MHCFPRDAFVPYAWPVFTLPTNTVFRSVASVCLPQLVPTAEARLSRRPANDVAPQYNLKNHLLVVEDVFPSDSLLHKKIHGHAVLQVPGPACYSALLLPDCPGLRHKPLPTIRQPWSLVQEIAAQNSVPYSIIAAFADLPKDMASIKIT